MLNAMRNRALSLGVCMFNGVEVKSYSTLQNEVRVETSSGIWKAKCVAFCTSSLHSHLFEDL